MLPNAEAGANLQLNVSLADVSPLSKESAHEHIFVVSKVPRINISNRHVTRCSLISSISALIADEDSSVIIISFHHI